MYKQEALQDLLAQASNLLMFVVFGLGGSWELPLNLQLLLLSTGICIARATGGGGCGVGAEVAEQQE